MVFIYILKCKKNKYYVGKTNNPNYRLDSHFMEGGSVWTKKYKPEQLYELIPNQTDHDEQRITQKYMEKYGIENVRGGPWCKIDISDSISSIQHILNSSSDKCYNCGSSEHFSNKCPKNIKKGLTICKRCNRMGHTEEKCYAKTYDNGKKILDNSLWSCEYCGKEFDTKKGCIFHENVHCPYKKQNKYFDVGGALQDELYDSSDEEYDEGYGDYYEGYGDYDERSIICYRCGRRGHYAKTCYAIKHIKGFNIK